MKTLEEIYNSITSKFKKKTKLDIYKGSVMDKYTISISDGIKEAYKEIENSKNPHIYTNLSGSNIDACGILFGCARMENEDDATFLYRMVNWNTSNQCGNNTAIETALLNLTYASNAKFVAFTQGVATGTVYIIPKSLEEESINLAIEEVKDRLKDVISKSSYVEYIVPEILPVSIVAYLSVYKDEDNVKANIEEKAKDYINNLAPGEYLEIGSINKIGINESNVNYFTISDLFINDEQLLELHKVQTLNKKFVFDKITWNMVVND